MRKRTDIGTGVTSQDDIHSAAIALVDENIEAIRFVWRQVSSPTPMLVTVTDEGDGDLAFAVRCVAHFALSPGIDSFAKAAVERGQIPVLVLADSGQDHTTAVVDVEA